MHGVRIGRSRAAPLARRRGGAVHWPGLRRIDFSRLSWEPDLSRDAMLLLGILVGIAQASGRFAAPVDALAYWQAGTSTNLYPESWSEVGTGYLFYPPPGRPDLGAAPADRLAGVHPPAHGLDVCRVLVLRPQLVAAARLAGDPVFPRHRPGTAGDVPGVCLDRQPPVDPRRARDHGVAPSRALGDRARHEDHRRDRLVVASACEANGAPRRSGRRRVPCSSESPSPSPPSSGSISSTSPCATARWPTRRSRSSRSRSVSGSRPPFPFSSGVLAPNRPWIVPAVVGWSLPAVHTAGFLPFWVAAWQMRSASKAQAA